jgi:hypothetical protein
MVGYLVMTPDADHWCGNVDEVRAMVAAYMTTEGAALTSVTVIHVPAADDTSSIGEELSPYQFWF